MRATLSSLTQNTTYHYRLVATNAADPTKVARGDDRTLRTERAGAAPSISSRAATGVNSLGATLAAGVNPRGLATTVRFEYGTSTSYGTSTPDQAIGAGGSTVSVTAAIGGLKPGTKYNYRAVATSAAGIARGGNRTFTTSKAPTGVAITPSTIRPIWGSGLTITGTVSGAGSIPVALEKQDFPYTARLRADRHGQRQLAAAPSRSPPRRCFVTTHLRVVTRTRGRRRQPDHHRLGGGQGGPEDQAPEGQARARRGRDLAGRARAAASRSSASRAAASGASSSARRRCS